MQYLGIVLRESGCSQTLFSGPHLPLQNTIIQLVKLGKFEGNIEINSLTLNRNTCP